jgi:hypothetical protein
VRERVLCDDRRAIGAIAASSPMVFFFLFSVVVIAIRQSDCCLSLDRMEEQPRGPSSNVETDDVCLRCRNR